MTEQLSLFETEANDYYEKQFIEKIFPQLSDAIERSGGTPALLKQQAQSDKTVVKLHQFILFYVRIRKKTHYISVHKAFRDLFPKNIPHRKDTNGENYYRFPIDKDHPVESYIEFLIQVAGATVDRYPKEWSCCSRYTECSNAKACVHPDKALALGCGYRKILNSGRIFYGENRNID